MNHAIDIDPEILAVRALQAKVAPGLDVTKLDPQTARRLANQVAMIVNDGRPELAKVETFQISGPAGELRARLYQPDDAVGRGAIYYIHGGGWFACDIDTHDRMLRYLAAQSGLSVFAIDYRLSPEHIFPAALEDCVAGWQWLGTNAAALGITEKIAIAGDSAGANLALAVTLSQRDSGGKLPAAAALLYGCFAPGLHTESRARYGDGTFGLTGARMDWYWAQYLGPHASAPPMLAAPFHANFRGLPPHYIGTGACDILADESPLIAERMRAAGVNVTLDIWPRMTHGFLQMTRDVQAARDAVAAVGKTLASWVAET